MSDSNSRITKLERKDIEALGEPYVDLISPGDDVRLSRSLDFFQREREREREREKTYSLM
jgi:hypothetical protein